MAIILLYLAIWSFISFMSDVNSIISSISNWNMDKTFQTKDTMFVRFDRDTNQVYFFQKCSQCFSLSSFWIRVLSSKLKSEVISRTSVIYHNVKKHMPFWSSFLLFRIIDPLNPIAIGWISLSCWDWMDMIWRNSFSRARVRIPHPLFLFKFII